MTVIKYGYWTLVRTEQELSRFAEPSTSIELPAFVHYKNGFTMILTKSGLLDMLAMIEAESSPEK